MKSKFYKCDFVDPKKMGRNNSKNHNLDVIYEIITIYRKMKKGKNNQNIYRMLYNVEYDQYNSVLDDNVDFCDDTNDGVVDFCHYRNLKGLKYIFYSKETELVESDNIFRNQDLLKSKFYWINIFNPSESDLDKLSNQFGVHDVTLIDIREKNTEEKIEFFKNYVFISTKLLNSCELITEDIDFNILIFKNFIITTHDKHLEWNQRYS
ncbi:putative metal ion transporter [Nosema bombycis CQ1]|uniref:Putative metal ion transporter n=1 Tax=Nosema bombycis (strain CQ1 / CVCC 102059) TaxID=578461 RepID=R0LZN2_NOSB1|nr:putative metal ion transporter [Nosema bombycis CQ1]|eukprot:EOB11254.1 putative metal ion transporter [Nosema bombycis CQ1]